MEVLLKAASVCLLSVLLTLSLGSKNKEFGSLICIAAVLLTSLMAVKLLEPLFDFIHQLELIESLPTACMQLLLKAAGIGLLSEMASNLCSQGGSSQLGKAVEFIGAVLIVDLSLPIYTQLLELIRKLAGGL